MLDINKKNEYSLSDAPPPRPQQDKIEINNTYYKCSECSSLIEILSISEDNNIIEYKCLNKNNNHFKKIMTINEYLEKMKNHKNKILNQDICQIHKNNKYISYCFDCNQHLCNECLKTRNHINHYKNNIIEIQPIKEELDIIKEVINDYKTKIENFKKDRIIKLKELKDIFNYNQMKENKIISEKNIKNENNKIKELKMINDKYLSDIEEIKKKYDEEIKKRKFKCIDDINKINDKYKLIIEKDKIIHEFIIKKLNEKYKEEINHLQNDKKIDNMNNIINISEILYNTYISFNNNYYNAININNIILSYFKNDYIKKNIIKKILKKSNEDIVKIILKRNNENNNINQKYQNNEIKIENKNDEINNLIKKYEKQIKILKEETEKQMLRYENKLINIIDEYDNQIKELREDNRKYIQKFEEDKKMKKKFKEINNEISIIYKVNKTEKSIKIFNSEFVSNNIKKCKILYNGKQYELQEEFNLKNIHNNKDILEIKLKGINNITNMFAMFYGCSSLLCLPDISKWDTSNVTDMSCLFGECSSLISLPDISKWDTSNVINMHSMFYKCYSLLYLPDISKWDTSNVIDMHGMFSECLSLLYVSDISKWNTLKVTNMAKMFKKCSSLLSLPDISKWNTSNVEYFNDMFEGCNNFLNIPKKFKK